MASVAPGPSGLSRLTAQLHRLSELAESLTVRLLELEERLEAQQARLDALGVSGDSAGDDGEERLLATEQRLERIERLLHRLERPGSSPRLKPLPQPVLQQEPLRSLDGCPAEPCSPWEGEQEVEQTFEDEQRIA